ncbi:MAG: hypothetical protein IT232_06355 [Flavobacteriales bacterium]|nr:hypothetical protein [Flavobacteriales bacterium]
MKKPNNIEDWYLEELSSYKVNPEKDLWDSISKKLDSEMVSEINEDNIEHWYKKEIEKVEVQPSLEVWNKLSTQLDIENVWSRLLVSLNRFDKMVWWRNLGLRFGAVAVLILGLFITGTNYSPVLSEKFENADNINYKEHTKNTNNSKTNQIKNIQSSNTIPTTVKTLNPINTNTGFGYQKTHNNINNSKVERNGVLYASINWAAYDKKQPDFNTHEAIENNIYINQHQGVDAILSSYEKKDFLVKKEKNKIVFNDKRFSSNFVFGVYAKRLYFGLNGGIKGQQLISFSSKIADDNLNKKSHLDYGYNIGATAGIIYSDKLNFETNINILSTNGYNKTYSTSELQYSEKLSLNYATISILAKKMNNKSTFDNKKYSTNLIGGFYGGYLTSAVLVSNNNSSNVKDNFKSIDFGIIVGIEQDRYLTKELVVSPGIRLQQGLINISSNSTNYSNNHTLGLEFNVGIKYIFLKKN